MCVCVCQERAGEKDVLWGRCLSASCEEDQSGAGQKRLVDVTSFAVSVTNRPIHQRCSSIFAPRLISPAVRQEGVWWSVRCLDVAQPDPESTDGGGRYPFLLFNWRQWTQDDALGLLKTLHRSQKSIQSQSTKPKCTKKARKGELTRETWSCLFIL